MLVKNSLLLIGALLLLLITILVSLTMGRFEISLYDLLLFFGADLLTLGTQPENSSMISTIIYDIRLPRIIAACLVGAALAVSGSAFQAMFVNPLVSPGILGVLAGSSFGAALGIALSDSWMMVQLSAFIFWFCGCFCGCWRSGYLSGIWRHAHVGSWGCYLKRPF